MGKKRKTEEQNTRDDPPEHATANEKKKTRVANYGQLSTETLLLKEQEVTRALVELQTQLSHMRSSSAVSYGNNELRQMNTKRYREEYALGEIKAEIERRARKKLGQAIPQAGIQGGSTAGVAATTTTNTEHKKTREVNQACSSVLAAGLRGDDRSNHSGGGVLRNPGAPSFPASQPEPSFPAAMQQQAPSFQAAMPPQLAAPQMGVNFHGGSALNAMAMMGAMGGMAAGPTPEEMAAASMQFQQMQQMQQCMQQMAGQSGMVQAPCNMPAAFTAPSSNVPAAFAKRAFSQP